MKKSLRITINLHGVPRDAFSSFVQFLVQGVRALHATSAIDAATMTIEDMDREPTSSVQPSVAPVSRSVN